MGKLLTVRVSKGHWYRGRPQSFLRFGTINQQCCIGFLARTLGAGVTDITWKATLEEVDNKKCALFVSNWSGLLHEAYTINDNVKITDIERMTQLRVTGKKMGIRFVFVP